MYAVTGATGHIGSRICSLLLEKGMEVKAVGRNLERLRGLINKGAEACVGTLEDAEFLEKTFAGAEAVFTMIPPDVKAEDFRAFQKHISESIIEALKSAHVKYVVNLSSLGAHLARGNGPIAGLHDHEERLAAIKGLNVVNMRPAFFMENLLPNIAMIKAQGFNGTPLRPDVRLPMIATRDIAAVAVEHLRAPGREGATVHELLGQRDLSMTEITGILGKAMGKPGLKYVQFPYSSARDAMIQMGLSASIVDLFIEMYKAINEEKLMHNLIRTDSNTTPTSFETFVKEVALAG
ncbi:MAG: hypothetical protein C0404_00610 [Verrucomicrobia bacterium]|nr:hypothetical protein [Verrucomicrobiota bacterium]